MSILGHTKTTSPVSNGYQIVSVLKVSPSLGMRLLENPKHSDTCLDRVTMSQCYHLSSDLKDLNFTFVNPLVDLVSLDKDNLRYLKDY